MVAKTKTGLGKGLSALMGEGYSQKLDEGRAGWPPAVLAIATIHASRFQPRRTFEEEALEELSASIKKSGVMQPIVVRPSAVKKEMYEIVAGERRWRAAKMAGLDIIPANIHNLSDEQALEFGIVENVQRRDLSPIEEARGYQRLIDEFSYTQESIAKTVAKSRSHVANLLRLLALPQEIRDMLEREEISMGHARALIGAPNGVLLAREIVKRNLSVRETEQLIKNLETSPDKPKPERKPRVKKSDAGKDADIIALEASLSESLGMQVSIRDRGDAGEITVAYNSLAQLDEILKRLGGNI